MGHAACLEITNGYYDTVPAFPTICLGTWERREWVGNQLAKGLICHGFSFPSVSGTTWPKSLKYMTFRFLVVVIERGGSGPSLSLKLTNQRDIENADCANRPQFHLVSRSAEPGFSRAPAAVGCRNALARHSPARRKSSPTGRTRSPRAPLVRAPRTDLARELSVASRSRSWGATVNRSASPRTTTFFGGYSHD